MEQATNNPSQVIQLIHELESDATKISKANTAELRIHFVDIIHWTEEDEKETYIQLQIESFMQNVLLLIDTNPKLTKIVLSILAKLTIINVSFGNFSESCFATLLDLMNASSELEKQVMQTIETEVIATLNNRAMEDISISLLQGLTNLISKS